ncbi:putative transmembrane protein [Toxoplasma gondii VAND]|uniref:Putative transmembrane protein n=1 Tax=Toxoplasma gondii VAND TaxID=933077 RepID=A0A086PJX4_TOXGO|nr:putative transmembrane protein [Toxoplasma gondii VAND]
MKWRNEGDYERSPAVCFLRLREVEALGLLDVSSTQKSIPSVLALCWQRMHPRNLKRLFRPSLLPSLRPSKRHLHARVAACLLRIERDRKRETRGAVVYLFFVVLYILFTVIVLFRIGGTPREQRRYCQGKDFKQLCSIAADACVSRKDAPGDPFTRQERESEE